MTAKFGSSPVDWKSALAPDAPLQNLAKLVNARLPNGARVNFCRLPQADGVMKTGITFQLGSKRFPFDTDAMVDEDSADTILRMVEERIDKVGHQNAWTEDDPDEGKRGQKPLSA
jgi:hypothetical protein